MKNIGGLNQFSAAANLTLSQHFLEKKRKVHSLYKTKRQESEKIRNQEGMKKSKSIVQKVFCL